MRIFFFLFLPLSLLFSQTFVYECQDNKSFIIQIRENDAWLFTKELSLSLAPVASQDGEQYENNGTVFFSQGYEAFLNTPHEVYSSCSNNRYKAVWEDSKLRGNDFRAIGNEPGWYLEIGKKGTKTMLVSEYGNEKYELSLPRPLVSKSTKTTRYRIKDFIDIYIESGRCIDSMTGKSFESKVKVVIDGKTYKGCGKALH